MKLIKRLFSKTPKIGRTLRNIGAVILGMEGAALTLPEIPESYIQLAQILLSIVMVIYGQYQTPDDLRNEIDAENK